MTDDKKLNMVCNILLILLLSAILYCAYSHGKVSVDLPESKDTSLPEEIQGVEVGDTLIVEKADSIIVIGFKR